MSARLDRGGGFAVIPDPSTGIRGHISLYEVPEGSPLVIPSVDPALIPYLNRMFPDRLVLVEKLGSVEAARGAREVVEHLIQLTKDQQDPDHVYGQIFASSAADGSRSTAAASGGHPGQPGVQRKHD